MEDMMHDIPANARRGKCKTIQGTGKTIYFLLRCIFVRRNREAAQSSSSVAESSPKLWRLPIFQL
jgi:hypothetical protein